MYSCCDLFPVFPLCSRSVEYLAMTNRYPKLDTIVFPQAPGVSAFVRVDVDIVDPFKTHVQSLGSLAPSQVDGEAQIRRIDRLPEGPVRFGQRIFEHEIRPVVQTAVVQVGKVGFGDLVDRNDPVPDVGIRPSCREQQTDDDERVEKTLHTAILRES
jgi:hypothetical protein